MNDSENAADPAGLTAVSPEQTLRNRAAERLRTLKDPELESVSSKEIRRALHELRVHQIELEIQNEDLRRAQEELEAARERYFDLYDFAPVGYVSLSEAGLILNANLTSAGMLGVPRSALINQPLTRFILPEDQDSYYLHCNRLSALYGEGSDSTTESQACELRMVKEDERIIFWAHLEATLRRNVGNFLVYRITLSNITKLKEAEDALRESGNRYRKLFKQHSAIMLVLELETGSIIDANEAAARFYGWPVAELRKMSMQEINILPPEAVQACLVKAAVFENASFEFRHRRADGTIRDVEVFSSRIESAGRDFLFSILHDVTEKKRAEEEREATIEFLRSTNECRELEDLIHAATAFCRKHSGCEAVGIRLKKGDDYPYYETQGFSEEFVLAEKQLCTCDEEGRPIRDSEGNPVLECMCGNVLCGRYDPSKPFFTPKGSFWSNSTTELLASTSEADRQVRTRNRCNGEGYESVALIPLQVGAVRLGLLQLNDRNKGRFTLETITLWERIADYLAVAVAKFHTEAELRRAKEEWERTFDSVPDLIAILDNRHRVLRVNAAMAQRLGAKPEECVGLRCYEVIHGTSVQPAVCPHLRTIADGCKHIEELHEDRLGGDFLVTTIPLSDGKGDRIGSVHVAHDITERKKAEKEIHRRAEELRLSNEELTRFTRASVGRELRMIALKKEVNTLCEKVGEPRRYPLDFEEEQ